MSYDAFAVPLSRHLVTGFVHATRRMWRWLGNLETRLLAEAMGDVTIDRPVYIGGLARAGSTILLEVLASHPATVSHQYRDFPFLYTPLWWHQILDRSVKGYLEPAERAHGDRLEVTPESPEAMEEVLWMTFFDGLHDPAHSNVLGPDTANEAFARFYRDHIRKLLHVHGGQRYLAKGNYNLTRFEYLLKLFPKARIIVPIRRPVDHIASLRKQHRLFARGADEHPRSVKHLDRVGHFEFGAHRRPINADDTETVASIEALWGEGEEVRGWARYWAHLYGWLADRLGLSAALDEATMVVRYEDLCAETEPTLLAVLEHCRIDDAAPLVAHWAERIYAPSYYAPSFADAELAAIAEETAPVARRFGYGD